MKTCRLTVAIVAIAMLMVLLTGITLGRCLVDAVKDYQEQQLQRIENIGR